MVSAAPLSLVYTLMTALFLSPYNTWYMVNTTVQAMGISQYVGPFMQWLRKCTVTPPRSMYALASIDISGLMLEQHH